MEITCYRDQEVSWELRQLPAATNNLAHTLARQKRYWKIR